MHIRLSHLGLFFATLLVNCLERAFMTVLCVDMAVEEEYMFLSVLLGAASIPVLGVLFRVFFGVFF